MRKTVLLDGNIYNDLSNDVATRTVLAKTIADGLIRVIATPIVVDELALGPFRGLPDWFPIDTEIESVAVIGYWHLGMAKLSEGEVFHAHKGESNNVPDAIIAESANELADVLVTNDRRCGRRLTEISTKCQVMNYKQFQNWLDVL